MTQELSRQKEEELQKRLAEHHKQLEYAAQSSTG